MHPLRKLLVHKQAHCKSVHSGKSILISVWSVIFLSLFEHKVLVNSKLCDEFSFENLLL